MADLIRFNPPFRGLVNTTTFFRVCNLKYNKTPFNGYIELLTSRNEGVPPSLFYIGVCASAMTVDMIDINTSIALTGENLSNVVYRDSDYLYVRIRAYFYYSLSFVTANGNKCEMTPASVTADDLILIL